MTDLRGVDFIGVNGIDIGLECFTTSLTVEAVFPLAVTTRNDYFTAGIA